MNEVGKRLARRTMEGRSSAARRWLAQHYEELKEPLSRPRPSWKAVADTAREDNVLIGPGGMRDAWHRLQKELAKQRAAVRPPGEIFSPEPDEHREHAYEEEVVLTTLSGRPIKP